MDKLSKAWNVKTKSAQCGVWHEAKVNLVKSKYEMGARWWERARWVGGGAGWHPRLDKRYLLIEANKPTSIQIATCKYLINVSRAMYYSLFVSAIWVSCDKIDNLSMAMGHVLLWPSSFDLVSTSGVFTQTPSSSYSKYYFGRPGKVGPRVL